MHKKPLAGKKTGARNGPRPALRPGSAAPRAGRPATGAGRRQVPRSVGELLSRGPRLRQLARAIPEQQAWEEWLRERLPAELAAHLVSVVPRGGAATRELVLFGDSAAWCARLRYALVALEGQIRARDGALGRLSVRVQLPQRAQRAHPGNEREQ